MYVKVKKQKTMKLMTKTYFYLDGECKNYILISFFVHYKSYFFSKKFCTSIGKWIFKQITANPYINNQLYQWGLEYTDYIKCRWVRPQLIHPKRSVLYMTKTASNSKEYGVSFHNPKLVLPVKVSSMDQTDMFEYLFITIIFRSTLTWSGITC